MTRAEIKTNLHTLHTTRVVTDIHGNTHPTRPLIQQIQEIDGETRPYTPGTPSFKSRPPGRLDVMDWIRSLHTTLYHLAGVKPPAGVSLMAWCERVANSTHGANEGGSAWSTVCGEFAAGWSCLGGGAQACSRPRPSCCGLQFGFQRSANI